MLIKSLAFGKTGKEDKLEEFSLLCIVSNWSFAQDDTDAKW